MDIEETIEAELEAKSIEKDNISLEINDDPHAGPDDKPKKTKKIRSQAQIEAFEKARIKRAENYQKRQLLKEQDKQNKKEIKTKITEEINSLSTEEIKEKIKPKLPRQNAVQDTPPQHSYGHYNHQPPTPIINNYYYNTPPPPQEVKRKGRKKKVVESSSSSEDEEEEVLRTAKAPVMQCKPQVIKQQPKKAPLKYSFV